MDFRKILPLCLVIGGLIFSTHSCKKEEEPAEEEPSTNIDASKDYAVSETAFNDVYAIVSEIAQNENDLKSTYFFGNCAAITISPSLPDTTFPKTVTIDFGNSCVGLDGKTRSGTVTATFSGRYRDSSTVINVTPNYTVNGYTLTGSKTITNEGRNNLQQSYFSIVVNGTVTHPNGNSSTWTSNRTRTWIEGENTTFLSHGWTGITDDVYEISGTGSGVTQNGLAYTANISTPLIIYVNCRWIVEGVLEITPNGLATRSIDYGVRADGCDNNATVSVNNLSFPIQLN
ncbi:MAG: hypothetical protein N4A35_08860 [Flavobacteriales bacterium]|jgi:archaellum component FlaF (FlaF/FlaG flagellin family)|nr:hypothetical protein [Flavobacteriales bacterium]